MTRFAVYALGGVLALSASTAIGVRPAAGASDVVPQVSVLRGERHLLIDYDPHNLDGTINAVIEIPAGTTAEYALNTRTGMIELEQRGGAPAHVQFLGYPSNYGKIPRTLSSSGRDGAGEPVGACVLGPALPIGSVVKTRPLGVLVLARGGQIGSTVILAHHASPFAACNGMRDLDATFPGVTAILKTWFASYRGRDERGTLAASSPALTERRDAIRLIGDAILAFERARVTEGDRRPLDRDGNPRPYYWPGAKNVRE